MGEQGFEGGRIAVPEQEGGGGGQDEDGAEGDALDQRGGAQSQEVGVGKQRRDGEGAGR